LIHSKLVSNFSIAFLELSKSLMMIDSGYVSSNQFANTGSN